MASAAADLCYLTISEAADLVRRRELSPVELTRAHLERIEAVDERLGSYVTVLSDEAMNTARAAEREIAGGGYRGPMHGIPIALKDLYATAGVRTMANSKVLADWSPSEDSTAGHRLNEAGAVLLGKLCMNEFALGGPDPTSLFPSSRNPWNTEHYPGGSSSGSGSAVGAGLAMGALGSDTGGSIRGPAAFCGITGLKPTYGRVSRYGVVPLSWTLDHCGPMTRTAEDAALMLQAIAGPDPRDPTASAEPAPDYASALRTDLSGLTVAVPRDYFFDDQPDLDPEVAALVEDAIGVLQNLGAEVRDVSVPSLFYSRGASSVIMMGEAYAYHERNLKERRHDFGNAVRQRFLLGALFTTADYVQAQRVRAVVREEFDAVLREADVIVAPSFPYTAPRLDGYDPATAGSGFRYLGPFNLSGLPAMSIPVGRTASTGLPASMQIAGGPFDESTVLAVGHAFQQETGWHRERPPL